MFVVPSPVRVRIRPAGALLGSARAENDRSEHRGPARDVRRVGQWHHAPRSESRWWCRELNADDVAANGEARAGRRAPLTSRVFDERAVEVISAADAAAIKNPATVKRRRPEPTRPRATA